MSGEKIMSGSDVAILVTMIVYLLFVLMIGVVMSKKNETVGDFYLGGRKLGPFVTAMSAEASDMSSYLLMGLPGLAYLSGMADVTWTAIGLALGTYLNWLLTAKRLRRYSVVANNSITVPEFFSNRYHDKKNSLGFIAALVIIVFFVPYTASGFAACGKLFASLFGVDYHIAMIISAAVIIAYTTLGGFLAASLSDFIQSIIMTIALVAILIFGITVAGGMDNVIANASKLPGYLSMTESFDAVTGTAGAYGPLTIVSTMAWGLGYFGMPHILLRFMAIKDENKLKLSRRVASIWVVIAMGIAILIGIIGYGMTSVGAIPQLTGADSETIIVKISSLLSQNGLLCAVIAGIALSGILAATMSTSDSQLLAASSSVSSDIMTKTFKLKLSEKKLMFVSRICLIIIALIGVVMAWDPNSSVFSIVSFAWGGFGAAFGPVMLLALFWKRSNRYGALAGMIAGGAMIFIWKFGLRPMGGLVDIYELLPAFIIALVVNIIVSLATKAPDKSIQDEFDKVKAMGR